jgi:23S rRNA pseudouridine2604 synthase
VVDNLSKVFPFDSSFFVAGRLDKASEGLLLISNDGKWVNDITRPESKKEKEYEVEVDSEIDESFIEAMASGVDIGFYLTQPCKIWKTGTKKFTIILTEGKNKQIRRMCKALKRKVVSLKRTRIDSFYLPELEGNMYRKLDLA